MLQLIDSHVSTPRLLQRFAFPILLLALCLLAPAAVADDDGPVAVEELTWSDLAFLEGALKEACDAVEAECGAKYPERPTLRITSNKEMREILSAEMAPIFKNTMGADEEQTKAISKVLADALAAKYEPKTNIVHVMPANIRTLTKAAGMPEAANKGTARILMAHEATHALDFQRFPALERERMNRKTKEGVECVGAMLEGHAQFVAERVAATWKLESRFTEFTKVITSGISTDDPAVKVMQDTMLAEHRFAYVQGHKFVKAVFEKRGREGVDAVLASPPTSSRLIERPEEFLGTSEGPTEFEVEPLFAHFRPLFEGAGWNVVVQPLKRMQMVAIFGSLPKEQTEPVLSKLDETRAFIAANQLTGQMATLIVMRYPDRASATGHLEITEALLHKKDEMFENSPTISIDKVVYEDGIGPDHALPGLYCMKKVSAGGRNQTVTLHCGAAKNVAFEFTLIDVEMTREAQDAYAALVVMHLLGKDTTKYIARAHELSGHGAKKDEPVQEKQPATPDAGSTAADAKALKNLATGWRKMQQDEDSNMLGALADAILPRPAELASLVHEGSAGEHFVSAYQGPLQGDVSNMAAKHLFRTPAARTEIHVHAATTEEIAAGEADEFPGGLRRFAQRVAKPGRVWYVVEIVEPGKDVGTKFSVFTKLGDRFVFLAKPWRYLPKEEPK